MVFQRGGIGGLRWADIRNTAPYTLDLMGDGLIGFAAKTKTRGKSEGGRGRVVLFLIPQILMTV